MTGEISSFDREVREKRRHFNEADYEQLIAGKAASEKAPQTDIHLPVGVRGE